MKIVIDMVRENVFITDSFYFKSKDCGSKRPDLRRDCDFNLVFFNKWQHRFVPKDLIYEGIATK